MFTKSSDMLNKNTWGVKKYQKHTIVYSIFSQVLLALSIGHLYNGGQLTKPIILVKICYKLLYVIQGVENSFGKVTSWPQLISEFLVAHAC